MFTGEDSTMMQANDAQLLANILGGDSEGNVKTRIPLTNSALFTNDRVLGTMPPSRASLV